MKIEILRGYNRFDIIKLISSKKSITGIELGVAQGIFSEKMISSSRFAHYFGVDMYSDVHDTNEYKGALKRVGILNNYKLLRMKFDEALDLFEDNFFDFIYVDGYAHSGEDGGKTIADWYPKLKVGGLMAGDDYHQTWPLVKQAVNEFINQTNTTLYLTEITDSKSNYSRYPTWATIKQENIDITPNLDLIATGREVDREVQLKRDRVKK